MAQEQTPGAGDPLTIPGQLRAAAAEVPDREAVVDGPTRLTFADLQRRVDRFARGLLALDVRPGDRVALWAPNRWEWVVAALGIHSAGAILVPINTRFKGAEARYAIRRSGAGIVVLAHGFLGADYLGMLREPSDEGATEGDPIPSLPSVRAVVSLDPLEDPGVVGWDRLDAMADDVPAERLEAILEQLEPDDLSDILFTSGTTGDPKGAMTTHRANVVVDQAWADLVGLRPADRYLLVNPLFHSFGYRAGMIACIVRRATMVLQAVFDVAEAMRLVEAERITVFPGAPSVYTTMLDHPDRAGRDLSSVRLAVTGAAVVPTALIHRMKDELGFQTVITAYGQTETCGTATVCPPDAPVEKISSTAGRAIPGSEVIVVGPDGRALPAGESGEILIRGHNIMVGYWQDPEATARTIDADGWLHTGDVGFLDDEGYLTITDRIKDMFTVGGFNVYPAEVERMLMRHPAVNDCAVVGVPDERLGEVGKAFVMLRHEGAATPEGLYAWARDAMANYKVPRTFEIVADLPRNAAGKVQKFRLPE